MAVERVWSGTVEPDHYQFYALRSNADWASDRVTDDGSRDRLWSDGLFISIGTSRKFGTTPIDVEVVSTSSGEPEARWQHVAEVSLGPGGPVQVQSWDSDVPVAVLDVDDGPLRVRVAWTDLVAGRFEGMEEDGSSDERLAITIWPSPVAPPEVLRRWDGWPW